jgi:hypothetical protein
MPGKSPQGYNKASLFCLEPDVDVSNPDKLVNGRICNVLKKSGLNRRMLFERPGFEIISYARSPTISPHYAAAQIGRHYQPVGA